MAMLLGEEYAPLCVFAVLFLGPECAFCVSHVGTSKILFEILYKWKVTIDMCVCVQFLVGDLNSYYSEIQDIFDGSALSTE